MTRELTERQQKFLNVLFSEANGNLSNAQFLRKELVKKGYKLQFRPKTSGPINAIFFDNINKTFQGGSSDFGEDYGIAW